MPLKIIEERADADAAYGALEASLTAWAGPGRQTWHARDALEPAADGATYARRDDLHLYLERTSVAFSLGVALTEADRDLLRIDVPRDRPGRRRREAAFARDDAGGFFAILGVEFLRELDVRMPFQRLAGTPLVKRAELAGRDYLLIGPLQDPRIAEALCAIASLTGAFEKHVSKLGAFLEDEDERLQSQLYQVSSGVRRARRVQRLVIVSLHGALAPHGFALDEVEQGGVHADFALSRGAETLVFEIRADASRADLVRGLGQLAIAAPRGAHLTRFLVLPAPHGPRDALAAFDPAFEELSVNVLFYDIENGAAVFRFDRADPALTLTTRRLFA